MEIFVSAADTSAEMHGAACLGALTRLLANGPSDVSMSAQSAGGLKIWGLGGDRIQGLGAELLIHCREFSVGGGPLEIISKLPLRRKLECTIEDRLAAGARPDLALLIDNGEINLRLASLFHFFKIPVVYYIPPKVWTWRASRLNDIADHVKLVLSILPFEEPIYKAWQIPFEYVGNPLLDEVPVHLTRDDAINDLGLDVNKSYVSLLPGSRYSEIKYHKELFQKTVREFVEATKSINNESLRNPIFLVPLPTNLDFVEVKRQYTEGWPEGVEVNFFSGKSHSCLKASRVALIKSGTSTLEAALLKTPMVITYQSGWLARQIFHHIIRYRHHVGMVNLFLAPESEAVCPELILEKAIPSDIARELFDIYRDGGKREQQMSHLQRTLKLIEPPAHLGRSPSEAVAKKLFDLFRASGSVSEAPQ
jgi:lipid-A-disaccharide synthase